MDYDALIDEYLKQTRTDGSTALHKAHNDGVTHNNESGPWSDHHSESYY